MDSKYFSEKPIWFDRSAKIDALYDKELLLIKADEPNGTMQLQVQTAEPNSPLRGKVSVKAWQIVVSNEPWENIEMMPTKAPKYAKTGVHERFLTQDALDSIHPHNARLLGNVELELVMQD